ncbi:sugar ABC transporter substrate-binding protein [Ilumatobacter sp.]|uniref:sugar ABC transporter substrate-binding protein n=1 Tax=Ilumatobacter sp. TaxID=1967498 RepID=UPI003C37B723
MRIRTRALAAPLALALAVAACGGSDDSGDSGDDEAPATAAADDTAADDAAADDTAADDTAADEEATDDTAADDEASGDDAAAGGGVEAAQAVVDANLVPPTEIGPTIPLDSVPEEKTVAWLQCSLPSCAAIGLGFEGAAEALGWNLEVISYDTDAAPAFQQAIDAGVDYVGISGTPPALIQDQLDTANAAGIKTMSCFDATEPSEDGFAMQCGDASSVEVAGDLIANAIIADSGGSANVMMVNIPDFTVLAVERDASEAAYAENCPDCTFNELALTLDQLLAGEVPGAIVSSLQADPSIDYVHFAFDGLAGGVAATLADADLLDGVSLVGVDYNGQILQEIVDGQQQFWTTNPKTYSGWLMMDAMARDAVGMDNPEERANAIVPSFLVNSPEMAQPLIATDGWPGPDNMDQQFAALWGV